MPNKLLPDWKEGDPLSARRLTDMTRGINRHDRVRLTGGHIHRGGTHTAINIPRGSKVVTARTVDGDSSYPDESAEPNVYAFKFTTVEYTEEAGHQSPTITDLTSESHDGFVFNLAEDGYLPEDTDIFMFLSGGQWYTFVTGSPPMFLSSSLSSVSSVSSLSESESSGGSSLSSLSSESSLNSSSSGISELSSSQDFQHVTVLIPPLVFACDEDNTPILTYFTLDLLFDGEGHFAGTTTGSS